MSSPNVISAPKRIYTKVCRYWLSRKCRNVQSVDYSYRIEELAMQMIRNLWIWISHERAFAAIFIITLALGVGANAALFSALRGYFLAPLPYPNAGRLIAVSQRMGGGGGISTSSYDYLRRNARSFSASGLSHETGGNWSSGTARHTRCEWRRRRHRGSR